MSAVMDVDAFWSRVEQDRTLARELIDLFFMECPKIFADVRVAAQGKDRVALRRAANSVRGLVANFSTSPAAHAATALEDMGRSGDLTEITQAVTVLDRQLVLLRSALVKLEEGITA